MVEVKHGISLSYVQIIKFLINMVYILSGPETRVLATGGASANKAILQVFYVFV